MLVIQTIDCLILSLSFSIIITFCQALGRLILPQRSADTGQSSVSHWTELRPHDHPMRYERLLPSFNITGLLYTVRHVQYHISTIAGTNQGRTNNIVHIMKSVTPDSLPPNSNQDITIMYTTKTHSTPSLPPI
ncbi:uncharacterized protein BO72DRAFT_161830 [Aspergillus fijiensis CBS 313.89]|uniref:Uncharacterized protein n=1 Tax=Aspergillus fijiensis CBS 313.89 TaxID=1448319 RepID=A0A8G1W0A9_9EURO|nr:uncharacterized protein BO72DRAFT_161830 [Aspergillus fijiensis CBS 313.89]RAK75829.1 hypothetical protein BO72DRAFT_161830 [Aspergillus fijiensis CBS 313.89]